MPDYQPQRPTNRARIKTAFVSAVLRQDAEFIRQQQNKIATDWNLFDTGELQKSLQGHFSVADLEGGAALSMRYLTYFRFLDMPSNNRMVRHIKREGYHAYNRTVFGILYNNTMPRLKYGFTEEVEQQIRQQLEEGILNSETKNYLALVTKSMRKGYY